MSSDKIFIIIASANEINLKQTVLSAIGNAEDPKNISFGIFDLCMNNFPKSDFENNNNVFYMSMEFNGTTGVGLSRLVASSIIPPDFKYVLQIDSHMIFNKNWDTELKKHYEVLELKFEKPIISLYPKQWVYDNNNIVIDNFIVSDPNNFTYKSNNKNSKLVFKDYRKSLIIDGYPTYEGVSHGEEDFVEHSLIAAPFVFSRSELYKEILHDPRLPWGGDEIIYSLRAWTRGYRMFSIKPNICFHYDKKTSSMAYSKYPKTDWRHLDNSDPRLFDFYIKRYKDGQKIMKDILLGHYIGYWGAPNLEKLKEFESACNINFKDFYDTKK